MAWNKSNTKQCKYCKTEIPGNAKECPNCHKKQGGIGKIILIVLVVLVVLGILSQALDSSDKDEPKKVDTASTASTSSVDSEQKEETPSETEEQPTSFKPGETAELNDVQVTFVSATENAGNELVTPADGKTFLIFEFEIANNSDKEVAVSSLVSFTAYCDDYSVDLSLSALMANQDKQQLDGSVAPGKKMNGIVGYEVPADWKTAEVNFAPDVWTGKEIKFVTTK